MFGLHERPLTYPSRPIQTIVLTNCILEHVLLLKGFGRLVDGSEIELGDKNYFEHQILQQNNYAIK